ncbi:hypothetical protein N0V90_008793 [Kalmusia sp. IMI 367209]|nr:hypothetical protein N0V90_008793 [Kalmusia sp. IMI 367209]
MDHPRPATIATSINPLSSITSRGRGGRAAMPSTTALRTYYGMNPVMAGGAHSYSYPGVQSTIIPPSTTTYTTVTNSSVPVPVASTRTTTSTTTVRSPQPTIPVTRDDVQYENRRIAMERGSYNPRRIKPADARPDDPFWCRERTGEWHLRTFYQIENECYPGRWLMDAEHGFLVFHRE